MRNTFAILAAAFALAACSFSENADIAEAKVAAFHAALNAGDSGSIYAAAADDLKKKISEPDFTSLLQAVHRKLGDVKSVGKPAWLAGTEPSGDFVKLTYRTQFSGGEATEVFVYRISNKQATLAGYNINALALITN